jgi:cytochrome c oxidase accessory protein FixG
MVPVEDVRILESPEAVLTTLTREGKRRWIYPTPSDGRYQRARLLVAWALIALFLLLPVVHIGGKPAVLLDVVRREFALFGLTFYPTDTLLLLFLAVFMVLGVVLFTALLGRVWCGWGCPQTVYLEFVFRPLERLIEGPEHVRKRRDDGPWTFDKTWRKSLKLGLYLAISLVLSHAFVAYFTGWDQLLAWMTGPPAEHWGFFVVMGLTTALVMFDFTYFREQMCTITCPYARLQSVLLDPDSLIVSYDPVRGEPRGRGKQRDGLGDCIDCFACVRTCPTGIDIRDGLQMECVACTQCIDACDAIMDKVGKPHGLIRYTSERALAGQPTRRLRPRTFLYSGLMLVMATLFLTALTTRGDFDLHIGRSKGDPYMVLPDGRIANRLTFRVRNQTDMPVTFTLAATQPQGTQVQVIGASPVALDPGAMKHIETWVMVPSASFTTDRQEGLFQLTFSNGITETRPFTLVGPTR